MNEITLCLTIGMRPELLRQTLQSLLNRLTFSHIIAINDFRDEATNRVFRGLCPQGQLISLKKQLGHHAAVDYMYQQVTTPYVMHCEDDWIFTETIDTQEALTILKSNQQVSQVCLRKISDFNFKLNDQKKIYAHHQRNGGKYFSLENIHPEWYGYTFNPHIASLKIWSSFGGFSQFKKERHISRNLRSRGMYTAFADPGSCHHIGEMQSVSPSASDPSKLKLIKKKIKYFLGY